MKIKLKTGIVAISILLSLSSISANAKNSNKRVVAIDYKCHIELIGGIQTIHFVNTKGKSLSGIAHSLVGKTTEKPFSKEKLGIYKVYECVALNDKFSNAQSNALDSKTVR